jgi:hypothetical protein
MRSVNEKGHNLSFYFLYNLQMIPTKLRNSKALRSHKVGWANLKGDTTLAQA